MKTPHEAEQLDSLIRLFYVICYMPGIADWIPEHMIW
jgi:hypothetical protein